jgi:hypothetical protein
MQRVQGDYARYFNRRHRRTGHLFEKRYKAYLVTDERYLAALVRYIHFNLPSAGLEKENKDPLWSSHNFYLGKTEHFWNRWRPAPGFEGPRGRRAYLELMEEPEVVELPPITPEKPYAYGEEGSWKGINRRKEGRSREAGVDCREIKPIRKIVDEVSRRRHVSIDLIQSRHRRRSICRVRHEAILKCLAEGYGPSDIGRFFYIRPTSVFTVIRRYGDSRRLKNKLINVCLTP